MKLLTICLLLIVCMTGCYTLCSCGRAMAKADIPRQLPGGTVVVDKYRLEVNTLFKDIRLGDYESTSNPFKTITPWGIVETKDEE